ncbi:MAG: hypothetical protein ACXWTN_11075 [Methylosarcina sp.]
MAFERSGVRLYEALITKCQSVEPTLDIVTLEQFRGVAIFTKACFGHPSPSKRQKMNATALAFGAPAVLSLSFTTQQGDGSPHPNDSTRFRKACIFIPQKALHENTCPIASGD